MSCCGDRRAALRSAPSEYSRTVRSAPTSIARDRAERAEGGIAVRYIHDGDIVVRGSMSGRVYRFVAGAAMEIPAADARALVAGGQFALDGGR